MKKERDQALHGKSLVLGKLHKSIVGTDVEGKIDNYFIFLRGGGGGGGWGGGASPLLLRIPSPPIGMMPP